MSYPYQKLVWKENRNKIIQHLNEQPLTFKQLIEKSGLSRSVVNGHLKALETKGIIKKEYRKGKILNVLQLSKIDLVEWFLSQLEMIGVPRKIIEKGKAILNEELLMMSMLIYSQIWDNLFKLSRRLEKELKTKHVLEETFIPVSSFKREVPQWKIKTPVSNEAEEVVRASLKDLSPYSLNMVLKVYQFEKWIRKVPKLRGFHLDVGEYTIVNLSEEVQKRFTKASEWWFEDVLEYLSSGGLFGALMTVYFNALLD